MRGFFAAFGRDAGDLTAARFAAPLAPAGEARHACWRSAHGFVVDAVRWNAASGHDDPHWKAWIAGELPGTGSMSWARFLSALAADDDRFLASLDGWFAILLVHKPTGMVRALTDRRAQQPLFMYTTPMGFHLSTAAAAFCRLPEPPAFDPGWLYDSIFFNHPVLDRSYLAGVSRVPPATVLSWRPGDASPVSRRWDSLFSRPVELVRGQEAAELERTTFLDVAADHFDDDPRTAVALTGGFDSRSALAAAPRKSDLLAYTYGLPGCGDMRLGAKIAEEIGVQHLPIELDGRFVESVPKHMVDVVRLSDGLERSIRAELMAAYPLLSARGRSLVVSGVSGDHLFRDHLRGSGNVPAIISPAMMGFIHGRGFGLEEHGFPEIFGRHFPAFRDCIGNGLAGLQDRYGDLSRPEGYQRYLVYESATKYFGGEAALASNFVRFRSIYWDRRLVELSFVSENGTLGLSERLPGKDRFLEAAAQARVILAGPHYRGGRVKGIRASTWASGNRARYRLEDTALKAGRWAANGFRRPRRQGSTAWPAWLAGAARPLWDDLLSSDARVRSYLDEQFLDRFEPAADVRLAGRLLTAEIILRQIEGRWPLEGGKGRVVEDAAP